MREVIGKKPITENLSSLSLFHFTPKLEYLLEILQLGFRLRYNYEKLPRYQMAYICPMICFCDIPFIIFIANQEI